MTTTAPRTWRVIYRNGGRATVKADSYADALARAEYLAPKLKIESICLMEDEQ